MIIGCLSFELYFPYSHSLKEKRQRLNKLRDRLKTKYNVAFAELDYQNKWQRARIGIVTLNNRRNIIDKTFQRILQEIEDNIDGEILSKEVFFY
jgi:uncharacterized protein YlxP (DUF503 family)